MFLQTDFLSRRKRIILITWERHENSPIRCPLTFQVTYLSVMTSFENEHFISSIKHLEKVEWFQKVVHTIPSGRLVIHSMRTPGNVEAKGNNLNYTLAIIRMPIWHSESESIRPGSEMTLSTVTSLVLTIRRFPSARWNCIKKSIWSTVILTDVMSQRCRDYSKLKEK